MRKQSVRFTLFLSSGIRKGTLSVAVFLTVLLAVSLLTNPSTRAEGFDAGIRLGMTATQVAGDQLQGFDKAGLAGGFFVSRELGRKTGMSLEMLYVQKGSRKPVDETDNTYYRMRLNYIEVPVLFRWHATRKMTVEAGPSFGVLVFAEEDNEVGVIQGAPPFRTTEWSFHTGLSYAWADAWAVDVRYGFSLLPVRPFTQSYYYSYWDRGQFNAVIELTLRRTF